MLEYTVLTRRYYIDDFPSIEADTPDFCRCNDFAKALSAYRSELGPHSDVAREVAVVAENITLVRCVVKSDACVVEKATNEWMFAIEHETKGFRIVNDKLRFVDVADQMLFDLRYPVAA